MVTAKWVLVVGSQCGRRCLYIQINSRQGGRPFVYIGEALLDGTAP